MYRQTASTWWQRNWKWFLPAAGLLALAVMAGVIGLVFYGVVTMTKSSEPYQEAVRQTRDNSDAVSALGRRITEGFFTTGSINTSGGSGQADLAIPVSGPKGDATIYLSAKKSAGQWKFRHLVIEIHETKNRIDLLEDKQAAESE